ncbi:MAG: DMT family transporter [Pseudorhodoplanes sp.]
MTTEHSISPAQNRRGMIALTAGMALYTLNDTIVKLIARDFPLGEIIFLRGLFSVVVLVVALAAVSGLGSLRLAIDRRVFWRAGFDGLATVFFVIALMRMKLAELSAVVLTSPLIVTALAALTLRVEVGWRRWAAIFVGLAGTLFIVKPTPATLDVWALVALVAAICSALRDLVTRNIGSAIPSLAVSVYCATAVMLCGAVMGANESWRMPDASQWVLVVAAGALLGTATYLIVIGFRDVDIPVVAPFRYTLLLWGALSGYFVFGEVPDGWAWVGAALIALSGLYALRRENIRKRDLAATAIPPA